MVYLQSLHLILCFSFRIPDRWWLTVTSSLFLFSFWRSWILEPPLSLVCTFIFCFQAHILRYIPSDTTIRCPYRSSAPQCIQIPTPTPPTTSIDTAKPFVSPHLRPSKPNVNGTSLPDRNKSLNVLQPHSDGPRSAAVVLGTMHLPVRPHLRDVFHVALSALPRRPPRVPMTMIKVGQQAKTASVELGSTGFKLNADADVKWRSGGRTGFWFKCA